MHSRQEKEEASEGMSTVAGVAYSDSPMGQVSLVPTQKNMLLRQAAVPQFQYACAGDHEVLEQG